MYVGFGQNVYSAGLRMEGYGHVVQGPQAPHLGNYFLEAQNRRIRFGRQPRLHQRLGPTSVQTPLQTA